jgi:hypothetical protein
MKVSELIKILEGIKEINGDIQISGGGDKDKLTTEEIYISEYSDKENVAWIGINFHDFFQNLYLDTNSQA